MRQRRIDAREQLEHSDARGCRTQPGAAKQRAWIADRGGHDPF